MISIVKELSSKLFNDIYIECYGRPANHLDLEDYLKRAKACEAITAGQLKKILSDSHWNYSKTWGMPTDEQLEGLAVAVKDDLKFVYNNSPVKGAEQRLLTAMVDTIKNIEIVSVILAFLIPEKYCIIAPPPEHMIGFRRRSDKLDTLKRYFIDYQPLAKKFNINVFNSLFDNHKQKYSSREEQQVVKYQEPQALVISKNMNYTEIDVQNQRGKTFTKNVGSKNAIGYTDLKQAYTKTNLVDPRRIKTKQYRNIHELEEERGNLSYEMDEAQLAAIHQRKIQEEI